MDKEVFEIYQGMVADLINTLKRRVEKAERLTIIALTMMLIQTLVLFGGIFYFLNNWEVEMTTETVEQYVEGDNTAINNIKGDDNIVSYGGEN